MSESDPTDVAPAAPREQVAILGGGMGSIMTAFELTATEELRQRYKVTIYQMGWRLGGKLASGANTADHYRNEEHGLHVWFGFYDNAFGELKQCYSELLALQADFRYPTVFDAFKPNDYTPIGHRTYGPDSYGFWDFNWPSNNNTPGECTGELENTLEIVGDFAEQIWEMIKKIVGQDLGQVMPGPELAEHLENYEAAMADAGQEVNYGDESHPLGRAFKAISAWFKSGGQRLEQFAAKDSPKLKSFIDWAHRLVAQHFENLKLKHPDNWPVLCAIDINATIMKGFLNPRYGLLRDFNLNRIDDWDLREWLIENGGNKSIVNGSSILRALYDIPFAYENGDMNKPNFAAGAALRWAFRSFLSYRGHAMYLPQTGFAEAVIAPYYKVLEARGVEFKFFHKVSDIELSANRNQVSKLTFEVQAMTNDGSPYDPVWYEDRLFRWPTQPLWDQLKDGTELAAKGVNFESHWDQQAPVGELVLEFGKDFDLVVLGIAGTAMKKRNAQDKLFCQSLIDASPVFSAWTGNLGAVCTSGVQFWFTKTSVELGWEKPPATVGGPEPTDVWADMTPVLDTEHWSGVSNPPTSVHYLCGPLPTTLFDQPASNAAVPAEAQKLCNDVTREWVTANGTVNWPKAITAEGAFDWNVMYDAENATGADRLAAQYLRANIDPTECCGNSFAGTTRYRPAGSDRLFTNLVVVGSDTNTGINVTCVEGATMSAMKASRSICGSPEHICNENFMGGPFPPPSAVGKNSMT